MHYSVSIFTGFIFFLALNRFSFLLKNYQKRGRIYIMIYTIDFKALTTTVQRYG